MFTVTLTKLYSINVLVKTALVPRKCYDYIISQDNSNNKPELVIGPALTAARCIRDACIDTLTRLPIQVAYVEYVRLAALAHNAAVDAEAAKHVPRPRTAFLRMQQL